MALQRRQSSCVEDNGVEADNYNLGLHVGALFIILSVSGSACAFPLLATRYPRLRIPPSFLFLARHFGTGVLLATAFVHLLPTAFISLGDPCLSGFWNEDYPAMPGAIALAAIFLVAIVEMVFSPGRHLCSTPVDVSRDAFIGDPLAGRSRSVARELRRMEQLNETLNREGESGTQLTPTQKHQKAVLQCMMLELGILFHSIFIGLALSVSIGNDFVVLLIAITFHQTFEGLALGSRIATIDWDHRPWQPWLMALAYGCTTPLGQAIGLATHTLYSPTSEAGLLMVGIMNAISAGLLTFASLVELLSEDFLSDESWRILRGQKRVWACLLVGLGAFGMALIGAWA